MKNIKMWLLKSVYRFKKKIDIIFTSFYHIVKLSPYSYLLLFHPNNYMLYVEIGYLSMF